MFCASLVEINPVVLEKKILNVLDTFCVFAILLLCLLGKEHGPLFEEK